MHRIVTLHNTYMNRNRVSFSKLLQSRVELEEKFPIRVYVSNILDSRGLAIGLSSRCQVDRSPRSLIHSKRNHNAYGSSFLCSALKSNCRNSPATSLHSGFARINTPFRWILPHPRSYVYMVLIASLSTSTLSFSAKKTEDSSKDMSSSRKTRGGIVNEEEERNAWQKAKDDYLNMDIDTKREKYKNHHITLHDVEDWPTYYQSHVKALHKLKPTEESSYDVNGDFNSKVSIWRGDITKLEIDAIINAANSSLLGGGGVDGAIHRAAGGTLVKECRSLKGCDTGDAKITGGYKLPAKFVIHTVGPVSSGEKDLKKCYDACYKLLLKNNLRSVAFPCISTGVYGFPHEEAAHIALSATREFLLENKEKVDRIIFCVFLDKDKLIYERLMQFYFPLPPETDGTSSPNSKIASKSVDKMAESSPSKVAKYTKEGQQLVPNETELGAGVDSSNPDDNTCKDISNASNKALGESGDKSDVKVEKSHVLQIKQSGANVNELANRGLQSQIRRMKPTSREMESPSREKELPNIGNGPASEEKEHTIKGKVPAGRDKEPERGEQALVNREKESQDRDKKLSDKGKKSDSKGKQPPSNVKKDVNKDKSHAHNK